MEKDNQRGNHDSWDQDRQQHDSALHAKSQSGEGHVSDDNTEEPTRHKHHQQHGIRKYEAFSNHSSADDQPQTTTDTNPMGA